jgi:GR25 family glycosyltransferase involved in LPS biosynthesis
MSAMLESSPLDWSYFDAHRGLEASGLSYDPEAAKVHCGRALGRQEIAVYSSHFAVIEQFVARAREEFLLILEDDVILDTAFPIAEFAQYCQSLGMDYVRLFGRHHADTVCLGYFYDRNIIRYKSTPAGTQAYLLTLRGAKILVDNLHHVVNTPDRVMDRFWEVGLPIYGIWPFPVLERFSPTQIPMPTPSSGELSSAQWSQWILFRIREKARKIAANVGLRGSDARIRAHAGEFRQIDGKGPSFAQSVAGQTR